MRQEQENPELYETDEEVREQPSGSTLQNQQDPPTGGDWAVNGPKDEHGHGDIDDDEASKS